VVKGEETLFGLGYERTREGGTEKVGEREPSGRRGGDPGWCRLDGVRGLVWFREREGRGWGRKPDVPWPGCGAGGTCGVRWRGRVCVGPYGV